MQSFVSYNAGIISGELAESMEICDGSRNCVEYMDGVMEWRLVTADGREIKLEGLGSNDYPSFYHGAGCFYMSKGYEIYRIDP